MKKKNKVQSEPTQRISYEEQFRIVNLAWMEAQVKLGLTPEPIKDMNFKPPAETTSVSMKPLSPIKKKDKI
tara:strand:- start:351 stop:563 length:213 start_codon:yes stop_codon:yes gene_type:complete